MNLRPPLCYIIAFLPTFPLLLNTFYLHNNYKPNITEIIAVRSYTN